MPACPWGPSGAYDFRVVNDESRRNANRLGQLDLGDYGELVLISYTDGTTGLREVAGEWHCTKTIMRI